MRTDLNSAVPFKPLGKAEPVARADGVAGSGQEALQRSLSSQVGKSMLAQVLARMSDGNFIVKVDGNPLRMMLPPGTKVGVDLPLTLLGLDPRPTFQVGDHGKPVTASLYTPETGSGKGAALSAGASAAGQAGPLQAALLKNTAAAALAPGEAGGLAPVLSETGRVVSSVIGAAMNAPGAAPVLVGSAPLIGNKAPDAAQLAVRLEQAISQSGLFYESHLAEWVEGKRSLSELMHEPQTARAPVPPTDPNTAQFINLQLSSQEQSRLAWQGQLAAGQPLEWNIEKDQHGQRDGDAPENPVWRSKMTFRLPLLGEIAASVVMSGENFQIEIQTDSHTIGSALRAQAGTLSNAMEAAGTPLSALSIGVRAIPTGAEPESLDD